MSGARLRNAVGLAMKAGKCVSGDYAVEQSIKGGRALLVLLDETASQNTKKRYEGQCLIRGVPLLQISGLGEAIGKPSRMTAAITDENFQIMIQSAHASQTEACVAQTGVDA